jgi:hypothetical protein
VRETIKNASVKYWTTAWISSRGFTAPACWLVFISLRHKFSFIQSTFWRVCFGLLFVAGCRNHARGTTISRRDLPVALLGLLVATVLPFVSADFNDLFMIHATIVAVLFVVSFSFFARPANLNPRAPACA